MIEVMADGEPRKLNNVVYLKVEFDKLDEIMEPEILEVLLNVLDYGCAENVGILNGPQFYRLDKEKIESTEASVAELQERLEAKEDIKNLIIGQVEKRAEAAEKSNLKYESIISDFQQHTIQLIVEKRKLNKALAEARNTFGKIDNHMEEGRSYPAEWWNELRKAPKSFVQWLNINGYYIGCYGEVVKSSEVDRLLEDFKRFQELLGVGDEPTQKEEKEAEP